MAAITISRQFGSGGRSLAERLCERFGYHLVDEFAIDDLAKAAKIKGEWLRAVEKEASSKILSFISSFVSSGRFYKNPAMPGEDYEKKKYVEFLRKIMSAMAADGNYVILGRGSQLVLSDHPKAFHVLLVSEYKDRVKFMVERYKISEEEAEKIIKNKENQRACVAQKIFGVEIDNPALYHIALNTSRVPFEWAFESVAGLFSRFLERI